MYGLIISLDVVKLFVGSAHDWIMPKWKLDSLTPYVVCQVILSSQLGLHYEPNMSLNDDKSASFSSQKS